MADIISIGRNIGNGDGGELPFEEWSDFASRLVDIVKPAGTVYFAGTGRGLTTNGVTEESFTVVFDIETNEIHADLSLDEIEVVRDAIALELGYLLSDYCQASAAWTVGETQFVEAR